MNIDFDNKRVVIRADGSRLIGMGHLVRQVAVAKSLAKCNAEVIFCVRNFDEGVLYITEQGFAVEIISIHDKKNPDALISLKPDILIHDFLETDADYMDQLKKSLPKCFFAAFDDLGNGQVLHHVLFDANRKVVDPGTGDTPESAKRFFGPDYMILRRQITEHAGTDKKIEEEVKNILVMFGGSDPAGLTLKFVSDWVHDMPDMTFRVILGPGMRNKHLVEAQLSDNIVFYENVDAVKMADLMLNADMAISSGGISMFEIACMGIPSIVIAQNKAETVNMHFFEEHRIIRSLGLGSEVKREEFLKCFAELADDAVRRKSMSVAGKKYVDGQGLSRIVTIISNFKDYIQS